MTVQAAGSPSSTWESVAPPRLPPAARFVLAALIIDLGGTRWASYLPTPVPGLYLADALLLIGCLVALHRSYALRNPGQLWPVVPVIFYVGYRYAQFLTSNAGVLPAQLWLRDMAPLLYVLLIPLLGRALSGVTLRQFIRAVRVASLILGLVVTLSSLGVLNPVEYSAAVPLFQPRQDADNVVLGIGVLAFGAWPGAQRASRIAQVVLFFIALTHYSRAGLIAASICLTIAVYRERKALIAVVPVEILAMLLPVLVLASSLVLANARELSTHLPGALSRLLQSDIKTGTTGARVDAWRLMMHYVMSSHRLALGFGPESQPVALSGAVQYLSGNEDVRAPHDWLVGATAYHGLIGLGTWIFAYVMVVRRRFQGADTALCLGAIAAYFVASLMGVIVESPFGSLPMAVFAGRLVSGRPRHGTARRGIRS